jgi:DNA-binding CsgD family transcriptional regulator
VRAVAAGEVLDRVARRCAEHDDERPMRIALIEELRRTLRFDWYMWALTDPETEVSVSPVATVPEVLLPELPRLIRSRYLTKEGRWDQLEGPVDTLLRATGGQPRRSLLYRDAMEPVGIADTATVVFRDRFGCWGWLELWREAALGPFGADDLGFLAAVAPTLTAALRRCQAHSFDDPTPIPSRTGPVVLVLSPHLEVRAQTPEADRYLRALLPPDADRRPIPAGAYNVAAQLLAVEAGIDGKPPRASVHLGGGVWLTFSAARMEAATRDVDADIAVTIEPTSPAERRALFARAHGLSEREAELLGLLVEGADTRAVAEALYVSQHTVQDHLKSIFAKTGARNRRTLLSRVTGR